MTSLSSTHSNIWLPGAQQCCYTKRFSGIRRQVIGPSFFPRPSSSSCCDLVHGYHCYRYRGRDHQAVCSSLLSNNEPEEPEDESLQEESSKPEDQGANSGSFRDGLEKIIGMDDSKFNGADLAALIRNKYGRSYDVQLIKKEFMGRNLLAMNVMWKYREQRSFPLTEEEYILRLDDVANNLKCWGAVSHIRNSLEKLKERPRIGKAVSIFIDVDDSGARSNEWIYK